MRFTVELLCNRVSKKAFFCLVLSLMAYPSFTEAQMKAYPHLQIFLVSSESARATPFIAFWNGTHQLVAGPFPLRLLERAPLDVSLNLSFSKPNEELPSGARLKIT